MKVDFTKEILVCPYCGEALYLTLNEYFCADCRKSFCTVTGNEIQKKKNYCRR